MAPPVRPGVFRPLRHEVPDDPVRVLLDGEHARSLGVAGQCVAFAECGSSYWPHGEPAPNLAWCPICRPWWTQIVCS